MFNTCSVAQKTCELRSKVLQALSFKRHPSELHQNSMKIEKVMSSSFLKFPVHVEAQIRDGCMTPRGDIVDLLTEILQSSCPVFQNGQLDLGRTENIDELCDNVAVGDMEEGKVISFWQADLCVHAFRLTDQEPAVTFELTTRNLVAILLFFIQQLLFVCWGHAFSTAF